MILTTPDVNVVLMDFPSKKGNEMVVPNEDGSYTILINAGLNYESQLKAYEHAMSHITNDDFSKGNVQEIEYYAHHPHKIQNRLKSILIASSNCKRNEDD